MKVAIIADIHSNLQALNAVVDEIRRTRAGATVCAGDIVGYGANPNECAGIITGLVDKAVLGNHDASALSRDTSGMNPYAARACAWTSDVLDDAANKLLRSLAVEDRFRMADRDFAMYHGSVGTFIDYVYEEEVDDSLLERADADVLILGHTHVPYVKELRGGLVVNPGSVGQPRDRDPRASLAIYDSESRSCEIRRMDYDIEGAAKAITDAGLPRMLAERLREGR